MGRSNVDMSGVELRFRAHGEGPVKTRCIARDETPGSFYNVKSGLVLKAK